MEPSIEPDYRFTLANERTFLAYERSAIGLVAAAVAVFQLLDDSWADRLLGGLLLVAGMVALTGGYTRFRAVERAIRADRPLPVNPMPHVLAASVGLCAVAAVLAVLV